MGAQVATQAVLLLLANLPAAVSTAEQVFAFVSQGISSLSQAVADKNPTTPAEVLALIDKEMLQAATIAALK